MRARHCLRSAPTCSEIFAGVRVSSPLRHGHTMSPWFDLCNDTMAMPGIAFRMIAIQAEQVRFAMAVDKHTVCWTPIESIPFAMSVSAGPLAASCDLLS